MVFDLELRSERSMASKKVSKMLRKLALGLAQCLVKHSAFLMVAWMVQNWVMQMAQSKDSRMDKYLVFDLELSSVRSMASMKVSKMVPKLAQLTALKMGHCLAPRKALLTASTREHCLAPMMVRCLALN